MYFQEVLRVLGVFLIFMLMIYRNNPSVSKTKIAYFTVFIGAFIIIEAYVNW
ncbi:hypothetical protein V7110_21275 [Neobacillus drentensis]|jgi:hypothetical protein